MKIKLHPALLALLLAILTPAGIATLRAQDASYPATDSYESEVDAERDRVIYSPGEVDANIRVHVIAGKDSINARPAQPKSGKQPEAAKTTPKPSSQEDDILSFNFLYYLFEKYKLQDIVD
jgi:hypothetical protein